MKRHKIRWFLVLFVFVFALSGCKKNVGAEEDNPVHREEPIETSKTYKFGFSCIEKENPYYMTLADAIRQSLVEDGHTIIGLQDDTNLDPQLQIEQIQEMIDEGIDAIFLTPVDWEAITPALIALKNANVKIINLDTQVADMDYVDAYIGSDNKSTGRLCAEELIEKYPEGGKVVILECPEMNSINERITGFEEMLVEEPFEVVARADVSGNLNTARLKTKRILEEHPDVVAIMCGNDPSAIGACVAANEAGIKNISIFGVDGSPEVKKELEKSDTLIAGTVAQSPINIGRTAVKVALDMLNGEAFERETYLETYMITKYNISMYGSDGWQ